MTPNEACAERRRFCRESLRGRSDELAPRPDPFRIDPMPLIRDAMRAQSERALALAREAGLEVPSAHD